MTIQTQFQLYGQIKKKGNWFIACCPPLDLSTQGRTFEEAKNNLIEAAQLFLISCLERGTLDLALKELGFVPLHGEKQEDPLPDDAFAFPVPIPLISQKQPECRA
ncbi:MAG: type II toxin-antitoxin system HicB family antitoxin [Acidobacteriota bacterium]|nr:type II toxin-antitoxin system HicB family antitoxin [Acidobacteriota bacterium]